MERDVSRHNESGLAEDRLAAFTAPMICEIGGSGWFLPVSENERYIPTHVRGMLCAVAMIYCFLGVAIVADIFMSGIQVIANQKKKVVLPSGKAATVNVWNDTVATLSLMALGSSAPEIFLSVMDLFKKKFHLTALGPATIVGSAGFNLLVIVGVCVIVIRDEEARKIKDLPAFYVTAVFSLVAYLWLVAILSVNSADVVDIWEAGVTFAFSPLLVWVSYKVDVGHWDGYLKRLHLLPEQDALEEKDEEAEKVVRQAQSRGRIARRRSSATNFSLFGTEGKEDIGPCRITFESDNVHVEGDADPLGQCLDIPVSITHDLLGPVRCNYKTLRFTAVPGYDYVECAGTLNFPDGCTEQSIELKILPIPQRRASSAFFLILDSPHGGASFCPHDDGGADLAILTVDIDAQSMDGATRRTRYLRNIDRYISIDGIRRGTSDWPGLFAEALFCHGSREEQRQAKLKDWVFHFVALPWKLVFAFVPPTSYFGGWPCFMASLIGIAFLCALLSDLAEMFGCVLDIPDMVTAITFMTLGTSTPDLFASLSAAREDATADAAIVNVTGSNSVNVFLGLGLPWTMGAIYWRVKGRTEEWVLKYPIIAAKMDGAAFVVNTPNLAFSVLVFIAACVPALCLLHLRRKHVGGELGGPFLTKVATVTSFVGFWLCMIVIITWRELRQHKHGPREIIMVSAVTAFVMVVLTLFPLFTMFLHRQQTAEKSLALEWSPEQAAECDGLGFSLLSLLRFWLCALVLFLWFNGDWARIIFWVATGVAISFCLLVLWFRGRMRLLRLLGAWAPQY